MCNNPTVFRKGLVTIKRGCAELIIYFNYIAALLQVTKVV